MIQDIYPCVFSNNYENAVPDEKSIVFHFKGEGAVYYVLAKENISDPFPKYGEISADKHIYLFSVDNVKYFLADGNIKYENYEYVSVRKITLLQCSPHFTSIYGTVQIYTAENAEIKLSQTKNSGL